MLKELALKRTVYLVTGYTDLRNGICVSAGSACAKGHRSHVLEAMKTSPKVMDGSFRVSLCRDTTEEELDQLVDVLRKDVVARFL